MSLPEMPPMDLNPHDWAIVRNILAAHVPQFEVWAFGSRVKWTAKEYSDLDLAVVTDKPLDWSVSTALAEAFDESDLPIKVDVVDWASTSEAFRQIIEKGKVVIQSKPKGASVTPARTFLREWTKTTLGEFVSLQRGHDLTEAEQRHGIFPDMGSAGQNGFHDTSRAKGPGVVIGRSGASFGQVHFSSSDFWPHNTYLYVTDFHGNDQRFVYYFLKNINFASYNSGSAQQSLNQNYIYPIEVDVPPVEEQRAIAYMLGAIDDKIEVNFCINAKLAETAQSIFKSWFVDFDLVGTKAAGRVLVGISPKIAALFPDGFEGSDLGEIPACWTATTLDDLVTERTGKVGNGNEHVVLSAVASGELKRSAEHFTKQVHSQDTSKYKRVEQWDYAYNPSRINIGSIGMLEEPIFGAVSPVYTVLRPAQGYEWFLRFFLDLPQTREVISQFCSGSVRQSLSFKDFAAIPVVLPPKKIAEAFTRRWQELNALRQHLEVESAKLNEVRDTLLPKLLSGELRVPDELMA